MEPDSLSFLTLNHERVIRSSAKSRNMRLTERLGRHCYNFQVWIKWNTFTKPPQSCPVFNKLLSNCESWDFSLTLDRLTENDNFCTLKDRKSAKHREILFFLKAVRWGLKIFGVSNVWFVYFLFFCAMTQKLTANSVCDEAHIKLYLM